jgi:hypothetical protein
MKVIGSNPSGLIVIEIDGVEISVPDNMTNPYRIKIWDEWEMGPPDPQTGERERVNTIPPYAPTGPTAADVDRERDRRIAAGFAFDGVHYQSRREDRENIAGASTAALAAIMAGAQPGDFRWANPDEDFAWIAADNSMHPMDAHTVFNFGKTALAHKQAHILAARTVKNMEEIPADYATNPAYWP